MDLFLQLIGGIAVCGVGVFFVFGGLLGSSMPAVLTGAFVFILGAYMLVASSLRSIGVEASPHTFTITIDGSIFTNVLGTVGVCVVTIFAIRRFFNRDVG